MNSESLIGTGNPPPLFTGWLLSGQCHPTKPSPLGSLLLASTRCHLHNWGKVKLPVAVSCCLELPWTEICAAPVSWIPDRVPRAFGSLEPPGGAQLPESCEPHLCFGQWLILIAGVGVGAFVMHCTSFPKGLWP